MGSNWIGIAKHVETRFKTSFNSNEAEKSSYCLSQHGEIAKSYKRIATSPFCYITVLELEKIVEKSV